MLLIFERNVLMRHDSIYFLKNMFSVAIMLGWSVRWCARTSSSVCCTAKNGRTWTCIFWVRNGAVCHQFLKWKHIRVGVATGLFKFIVNDLKLLYFVYLVTCIFSLSIFEILGPSNQPKSDSKYHSTLFSIPQLHTVRSWIQVQLPRFGNFWGVLSDIFGHKIDFLNAL